MQRKFLALAAVLVAAMSVAVSAVAATPPTLTGEFFSPGTGATSDACSFAGGTATFTFTGNAAGPYAGPYTETLTISYGPIQPGGLSTITGGSATFAIAAGDTTVTGTKNISGGSVNCIGDAFGFKFDGTYSATIATPTGGFHDEGTTGGGGSSCCGEVEDFTSSLPAPVPLLPTSTSQCKKGGWQSFGVFKNQGDCVSFVATGGKNQPG